MHFEKNIKVLGWTIENLKFSFGLECVFQILISRAKV